MLPRCCIRQLPREAGPWIESFLSVIANWLTDPLQTILIVYSHRGLIMANVKNVKNQKTAIYTVYKHTHTYQCRAGIQWGFTHLYASFITTTITSDQL